MNLKDKKVLVAGLGKSGMAAFELLKHMGAHVSLYDGKKEQICQIRTIGQLWLLS